MNDNPTTPREISRMRSEAELLREEVVRLFIEEQELLHIVKPNLLRLHTITVGAWELRRLEAELVSKRLHRKIAMIEQAMKAGEAIRLDEIDERTAAELAEDAQRIRTLAAEISASRATLSNLMSDADEADYKGIYAAFVRRFHPALAGHLPPDALAIWERVQHAYARQDPRELQSLEILARDFAPPPLPDSCDALAAAQKRFRVFIAGFLRGLATLRVQHPFVLEKSLADDAWIQRRRDEFDAESARLAAEAAALETRLAKLLPEISMLQRFGNN